MNHFKKKKGLRNSGSLAFSAPHNNKNISHVIITEFQFVRYIISRKIYTCSQKFSLEGRSFRETIRLVERKILCFGKSKRGALLSLDTCQRNLATAMRNEPFQRLECCSHWRKMMPTQHKFK